MLERFFQLQAHGTTVRTEVLAGLTTFLTMAYIVFVNPDILSAAGMPRDAVFVATCLAAAIGTAIMGLYANYPVALAPAMGLNAYFAFTVVQGMGYTWQAALGAVLISGGLFILLSLFKVREWIVNAIPTSLKYSISAGIGLFLAIIGLKNAGLITAHPATLLTLGNIHSPGPLLAAAGFMLIAALEYRKVPGAIIIAILAVTGASVALGLTEFKGIVAAPPSLAPTFMQLDLAGALNAGLLAVVLTFFMVELFDASGTLVGVCHRAGLLDKDGKLPRLKKALLADSVAISAGAVLCRHPDVARPRRDPLGRPDRGDTCRRHGNHHPVHFFDRARHFLRLHFLCRHQGARRSSSRRIADRSPDRCRLHRQIRTALRPT